MSAAQASRSEPCSPSPGRTPERLRVAYIMSRFPKLTETFVLDEMLELERRGVEVEVLPLWREREGRVHPEARALVERAYYTPTLDAAIVRDNLRCLLSAPAAYLGALATLLRANLGSLRFLAGALAIFPKACHFALRVRALGARHVHAHFASHPAAAAFVVGRLSGVPWSFTAHGSDLHREQSMLREKVAEARFAVTISEYNRRFMLERVGEAAAPRVHVIHCGVDPEAFPRRRPGSGLELALACVGTLHAVKGQRFLLDACAELSTRGVAWRCHLVGDGPDRRALEARALRLGIAERVVFHGSCEREEVRDLLGRVDVGVAPSVPTSDGRREGIPVALMEAAAVGLPLVASRLSGIPELVREGETGLLVPPGDARALARALERLAADAGLRERLGAAARERVEAEFGLAEGVARLEGLMRAEGAP